MRVSSIARRLLVTAAVLGCAVCASAPAYATFPGQNGKIVFSKDGDLWTINPDGSDLTQVTTGDRVDWRPKWAPDGSMIAFNGDECAPCDYYQHGYDGFGVYVLRSDGSPTRFGQDHVDYTDAAWSRDRRLVFTTEKNAFDYGEPIGQGSRLVVTSFDGKSHEILDALLPPSSPDWSPIEDRIIVLLHYDGSGIYFYDLDGNYTTFSDPSGPNDIPFSYSPSWSPDGTRIAWVGGTHSDPEGCPGRCLYTADPDGSDVQRLSPDRNEWLSSTTWSPDGSLLAFTRRTTSTSDPEVWLMNADGTDPHFLTEGSEPDWQPRVSPQILHLPRLLGVAREGQTLTATPGDWLATPELSYAYQWGLCDSAGNECSDIAGETGEAYTLPSDAVMHTVRVRVTATNDLGVDTAQSRLSAIVGEVVVGTRASDSLGGTLGADRANGLGGSDTLTLKAGNDLGRGGLGKDAIRGGSGADILMGESGRDRLLGGAGHDRLRGGSGRDRIYASDGTRDLIVCGPGRDFVVADHRDFVAANCNIVRYR